MLWVSNIFINSSNLSFSSNSTITLTVVDDNYAEGSVVGSTDSDEDIVLGATSTTHNFVWSDNSNTSHDVTSSADWTNGFLVDSLMTDTHTVGY